ncbi:hypothetical protein GCM10009720_20440 [Yaniella flava]|uniref:Uncharacterized protein n=1 Tax=Yaniella flava TaxID=287930 RepID=A0ABP5G419_9MICC
MKSLNILHRVVDTLRPAAPPSRPAVLRLGTGAFTVWNNLRRRAMFHKLNAQHETAFDPVGPVRVLRRPLPPRVANALFDAAQVTNMLTTLGVAHRVTGPVNAVLQLWTLSYRNSWGMIFHHDNMALLHQMVLGVTRSADALSVDALVRENTLWPRRVDRAYGGIASAMNVATCSVYFISGVAKVRSPQGWKWASGNTLRDQIAADAIRKEVFGTKAPDKAHDLYNARGFFTLAGVGALAIELGSPLSMVHRRCGQVFSIAAWGMHIGIRYIMGIKFPYNTSGVSYLPYFPVR